MYHICVQGSSLVHVPYMCTGEQSSTCTIYVYRKLTIDYKLVYRLLDSLVVECWLRVGEVPGSIPNQSRTASYQRRYTNGRSVDRLFSTEHSKGKYWLFLKNYDLKINVMDKIWDKKILWSRSLAGWKKRMIMQNRQKLNAKKNKNKLVSHALYLVYNNVLTECFTRIS